MDDDVTFDGISLGPVCVVTPYWNPVALQINEYPGIDGLEVIAEGERGGTIEVEGVLAGPTRPAVKAQYKALQAYHRNAAPATLVDQDGDSFDNCVLLSIRWTDRGEPTGDGGYARPFQAVFLYLGD